MALKCIIDLETAFWCEIRDLHVHRHDSVFLAFRGKCVGCFNEAKFLCHQNCGN